MAQIEDISTDHCLLITFDDFDKFFTENDFEIEHISCPKKLYHHDDDIYDVVCPFRLFLSDSKVNREEKCKELFNKARLENGNIDYLQYDEKNNCWCFSKTTRRVTPTHAPTPLTANEIKKILDKIEENTNETGPIITMG